MVETPANDVRLAEATPCDLPARGTPQVPADLVAHNCIVGYSGRSVPELRWSRCSPTSSAVASAGVWPTRTTTPGAVPVIPERMPPSIPLRVSLPTVRDRLRDLLAGESPDPQRSALDRFAVEALRRCEVSTTALRMPVPVDIQALAAQASFSELAAPIQARLEEVGEQTADSLLEVLDAAREVFEQGEVGPARRAALARLALALSDMDRVFSWT